ncbi:hypothetical protein, partial [Acinetobacter sp. ATCC 27244]|uniref:hypothetical protein n=1 Tax=Acinetobacter sp. (strain ATCC 27244 / 9458) TaxID=525244 RepID=UPI001CC204A3
LLQVRYSVFLSLDISSVHFFHGRSLSVCSILVVKHKLNGIDIALAQTNGNLTVVIFPTYIKKVDLYECSRNC